MKIFLRLIKLENSDVFWGRFRYKVSTHLLHYLETLNCWCWGKVKAYELICDHINWWVSRHHLSFLPLLGGAKGVVLHVSPANNKKDWGLLEELKHHMMLYGSIIYKFLYIVQYSLLKAVKKWKLIKKYHQGSNTKVLKKLLFVFQINSITQLLSMALQMLIANVEAWLCVEPFISALLLTESCSKEME